jgi:glycyl-tRNA synthetase beta subunit
MVMTDDMAVRRNRLALLGLIATLFGGVADFSKLST